MVKINEYGYKFSLPIDEGLWIYQSFIAKTDKTLNDKLRTLKELSQRLFRSYCPGVIEMIGHTLHEIEEALNHNDHSELDHLYRRLESSIDDLRASAHVIDRAELEQLKEVANDCAQLEKLMRIKLENEYRPDELTQYKSVSFEGLGDFPNDLRYFIEHIDYAVNALQRVQEIIEPMLSFAYLKHALEVSDDPQKLMEDYMQSFKKLEELSLPLNGALAEISKKSPYRKISVNDYSQYMTKSNQLAFIDDIQRFTKQKQSTFRRKVDPKLIEAYVAFAQEFAQSQKTIDTCVRLFELAMKYSSLNDDGSYKYTGEIRNSGALITAESLNEEIGSKALDEWVASQPGYVGNSLSIRIFAEYDINEEYVKVTIKGDAEERYVSNKADGYLHGVPIKEHPEFVQYRNEILQENDDADPNEVDSLALENIINDYGRMTQSSFSPSPEFVFEYKR